MLDNARLLLHAEVQSVFESVSAENITPTMTSTVTAVRFE
jgi:hypothetical protein